MQSVPSTGGEVPAPEPIRAMERWRVTWHGRRDAKRPLPGAGQPQPYLESLRAHAEIGRRTVGEWLHGKLDPIDREAVRILVLLDQRRRNPAIPPDVTPAKPVPDDADPQPLSRISPRVRKAREAAAAQQAYRRWVHEQEEAEQRLGQLGSTRHHLIEIARAAASAHEARYRHLVGLYDTAHLRRDPDRHRTGPPPIAAEPWLTGDLPLLALEIEGALAEKYRWRLKDSVNRTSIVTFDVTPNPN